MIKLLLLLLLCADDVMAQLKVPSFTGQARVTSQKKKNDGTQRKLHSSNTIPSLTGHPRIVISHPKDRQLARASGLTKARSQAGKVRGQSRQLPSNGKLFPSVLIWATSTIYRVTHTTLL
jgi:hypothetical protein